VANFRESAHRLGHARRMSTLTIGALSAATGCKIETIRYYEKIGLLPAPGRTAGGFRVYDEEHRRRLGFIRHGRDLGLSIDAIRELLGLASDRRRSCARIDRIVQEHLVDIEAKIAGLSQLRDQLRALASRCRGGLTVAECQVLDALAGPDA
jgi:DNA-binding transcriptional MerR regulator